MKILTPGHVYQLDNFDELPSFDQVIHFIQKEKDLETGELKTISNGTTNEEVLYMLVDRLKFLNEKMESVHNVNAIHHLNEALNELNMRTADRLNRGVEGTVNN